MTAFDFLVCGSGIAGASIAYELAAHGSVLVVEREDRHGYHTTGRSAAMYIESYGAAPIRALTAASRGFFDNPPEGFADYSLLTPRGALTIAPKDRLGKLKILGAEITAAGAAWRPVGVEEARAMVPALRPEAAADAVYEPNASDIDTNALHSGFLRLAKIRGAQFRLDAEIVGAVRSGDQWRVKLADGEELSASVLINAAGAWADHMAILAGARPLDLGPKRRTAILIDPPAGLAIDLWPNVIDVDERFYFKPDAGRILASPADETPSPPLDAAPEELDIALCVERVEGAIEIEVRRVARAWAGLRTFAPDRVPVFGYDATTRGFFWFAGQGGYGMQTAPAAARLGAALALGDEAPADLVARRADAATFSPSRFMAS
jgi:D-arginine dehydrogenase